MARFALALVLAVVACGTDPAKPLEIAGYYKLLSINGQPLPFQESSGAIIAGGLTIAADSGWTVGDTTSGLVPGTFTWGGKVAPAADGWVFTDSLSMTTRYTGTIAGDLFTLTSTRTYLYQRRP